MHQSNTQNNSLSTDAHQSSTILPISLCWSVWELHLNRQWQSHLCPSVPAPFDWAELGRSQRSRPAVWRWVPKENPASPVSSCFVLNSECYLSLISSPWRSIFLDSKTRADTKQSIPAKRTMNIYLWKNLNLLSGAYFGGGCVVDEYYTYLFLTYF